ncbi:uncharacterized protein [Ptychodera flava]|uniref:uncharacterized protein n=1 Tax=Ptychodera flava TaxID=63121 RepID=UPI003969BDD7
MEHSGGPDPLLLLRKVLFQMASELGAIPGHSVFLKVADDKYGSSYYGTANLMRDYLGDGVKVQGKDNSFLTKTDIDCMFERLQPNRSHQNERRGFDSNLNDRDSAHVSETSEYKAERQSNIKNSISKLTANELPQESQNHSDCTFKHHPQKMEIQCDHSRQPVEKESHSDPLSRPQQQTEGRSEHSSNQHENSKSDQVQLHRHTSTDRLSQDSQIQHRRDSQSDVREVIEIDSDAENSDSFQRESEPNKSDVGEKQIARISYSINRKQDIARENREKSLVADRQLTKKQVREDRLSDSERYLNTSYDDSSMVTDTCSATSVEDRGTAGVPLRIENVMSLSQIVVPMTISSTQSAMFTEPMPQSLTRNSHSEVQGFSGNFLPTQQDDNLIGMTVTEDPIFPGPSTSPPPSLADRIATTQFSMSKNLVFRSKLSQLSNRLEGSPERSKLKMCRLCGKHFPSQPLLSAHIRSHRKNGEKPYECDQCNVKCVSVYNLKLHKERVHSVSDKNFPCPCCAKKFRLQIDLNNHFRHYCKAKKLASQMKTE